MKLGEEEGTGKEEKCRMAEEEDEERRGSRHREKLRSLSTGALTVLYPVADAFNQRATTPTINLNSLMEVVDI